ncbi:MAG: Alkaline phosphatase [Planctomycetota bacterium]|nr:Alkaline phosphatase [Planctomycetota bacterium]
MTDQPICSRRSHRSPFLLFVALGSLFALASARAEDPLRDLQNAYVRNKDESVARAYHWGSQGAGNVFSNHTSHTNRLIPIYVFGAKADLDAVTGKNSAYRDPEKIKAMYAELPPNTANPRAEYCDQSDLYRVQKEAAEKGAKYIFTVWFDGMDWETTRAAAIAKTGRVYTEGKGSGLIFQDYDKAPSRFGYCVTSPTHDKNTTNVDTQTLSIPPDSLLGGYDAMIAGPNPWTEGPLQAPGYLKGQNGNTADKQGILAVGRLPHAYTDSSTSAAEYATGVKSYNNGVNVTDDGRFVPTLYQRLQSQGWKVGTVTSVPFNHASPAAMYAHNVHRDDYQDIGREMLGRESIVQKTGKGPRLPGLDVVLGAGYGQILVDASLKSQGANAAANQNLHIADADLKAIDVKNGGKYVVVTTSIDVKGDEALAAAAESAANGDHRLFGFFGTTVNHLPFRTANGDFRPSAGLKGTRESYSADDLQENPTLADMTRASLKVLSAKKGQPFALFVEAGDVDFALHDNNLDNAIGAVYSGEAAIGVILEWIEAHSNWDESVLIVTSDHGHYLVLDDPEALAATAKPAGSK